MKKLVLLFGLALSVTLMVQCRKEIINNSSQILVQENYLNINKAKAWFESNKSNTLKCEPQWASARQLHLGKGMVEVSILINGATIAPTISQQEASKIGASRLIVQVKDDGGITGCILQYAPSNNFLGNIDDINWANAGAKKYDGILFFKNLRGEILRGIVLKEGHVISKDVSVDINIPSSDITARNQRIECVDTWWYICVQAGPYTTCNWERGARACYTVNDNSGGGNINGPISPGGDLGGGGVNTNNNGGNSNNGCLTPDCRENNTILFTDCSSWNFNRVGPGSAYQASGVSGMYFNFMYSYLDSHNDWQIGVHTTVLQPFFFEMPAIRTGGTIISPGLAANLCAKWFDEVETQIEIKWSSRPPRDNLEQTRLENDFLDRLRKKIETYGGRLTKNNNYGVGLTGYGTSVFPTDCD